MPEIGILCRVNRYNDKVSVDKSVAADMSKRDKVEHHNLNEFVGWFRKVRFVFLNMGMTNWRRMRSLPVMLWPELWTPF